MVFLENLATTCSQFIEVLTFYPDSLRRLQMGKKTVICIGDIGDSVGKRKEKKENKQKRSLFPCLPVSAPSPCSGFHLLLSLCQSYYSLVLQ